ncbi:MAG: argininosuccinate synthase [Saprospiraceae bacterium]|nr:argininosuccinate synthase [Saprospiraceae bacterium]
MTKEHVVLAYSGGLDTSFCVKYLQEEKGLDVHAVLVQTGGYSDAQLEAVKEKALQLGAVKFEVVDATRDYYDKCLRYLIFGNVLRNQTYPMSVSAERMFQALAIVRYANASGAKYVAHGSTGAGNDQVRFDLAFEVLGNNLEIFTPIRDLKLSRQDEIAYLEKHGVSWSWEKAKYSINQGIWGTSVGGAETLTSDKGLPEGAWPHPVTRTDSQEVTIGFEKGEPVTLDGQTFAHPVGLIEALEAVAVPFGVGRDIHVGDTIIGIKGRVGFAAAAALILIRAHHLLEKHTLGKWQQYWKEQMANWYGMFLHEAQFLDPVMRNIETFLADTQKYVSGEVRVLLHPYRFECLGVRTPNDLMQTKFGQYGEMNNAWTGEDVKGFTTVLGNASKLYFSLHEDEKIKT